MSITIDISKEAESKLKIRADEMGKDFPEFVEYLVEREAHDPDPSFDEIVAPIHKAFEESGMTQEELDDFSDHLIREVRAENPRRVR